MASYRIWLQAFRLHTLPLAFASIGMGNFLAASSGHFSLGILILTIFTAVNLQILSNLANDFGDTRHGADNERRVGPKRAVQSGNLSIFKIKKGIIIFVGLSLISGLGLLSLSASKIGYEATAVLLIIGLLSIAAAIAYTATKSPYGYSGLGDLSVLLFFGIVGVGGSYFLQVGTLGGAIIFPALAVGLLCTGVLNINNMRDIESDAEAGKRTVALRLGHAKAKLYHWSLLLGAMICILIYSLESFRFHYQYWFLLPSLLFITNGWSVYNSREPIQLNPFLKQLAFSTLIFSLMYGLGIILPNIIEGE